AQKLPLVVAGAALVASAILGVSAYFIAASTVTAMTEDRLRTVAIGRAHALEDMLEGIKSDLLITASSSGTVSALGNLAIGWPQIGADPAAVLREAFITNNPHPAEEREKLDMGKLNQGATFDIAHSRLHPGFR